MVNHERPDLQESAQALVRQLAEYTITLKQLEDNLLARLAASQGDILEDIALIEGLVRWGAGWWGGVGAQDALRGDAGHGCRWFDSPLLSSSLPGSDRTHP